METQETKTNSEVATASEEPTEVGNITDIAEPYESYEYKFRTLRKGRNYYCSFGFIKTDEKICVFLLHENYCKETIEASKRWTEFYLGDVNPKFYLTKHNMRMLVMAVDRNKGKVYRAIIVGLPRESNYEKLLVLCVDEGALGIFRLNQLYYPTAEFVEPAWRTVACYLGSGLDFFVTEPEFDHAFDAVKKDWINKSLLIQCQGIGTFHNGFKYQVVSVYDAKSGPQGLSLTQLLLDNCLTEQTLGLRLPVGVGSKYPGYILHAEPDGTVFIRPRHSIISHLEQVLGQLTFKDLLKQVPGTTLEEILKFENQEEIYIAEYYNDEVYRAVLKGREVRDNKVEVEFIDYGNTRWVTAEQMILNAYLSDSIPLIPPLKNELRLEGVDAFVGDMLFINEFLQSQMWQFVVEGPGEVFVYALIEGRILLNKYLLESGMAIGNSFHELLRTSTSEPEVRRGCGRARWLHRVQL